MSIMDDPRYRAAAKRVNEGFASVNRAEVIPLLEMCRELERDVEDAKESRQWFKSALDHIARVAMGARKPTPRLAWIIQRAKSELNGDSLWQEAPKPAGYHDALHRR